MAFLSLLSEHPVTAGQSFLAGAIHALPKVQGDAIGTGWAVYWCSVGRLATADHMGNHFIGHATASVTATAGSVPVRLSQ